MSHGKKNINLNASQIGNVIGTLTPDRMQKYISAAKLDPRVALSIYSHNSKISAALMVDLHFLEIALRNAFDKQLTIVFNIPSTSTSPEIEWFNNPIFLNRVCPLNATGRPVDSTNKMRKIIDDAVRNASKGLPNGTAPQHGKVIAELTFGFWHRMTNKAYDHQLWIPCLNRAFISTTMNRATAHNQLETIRLLRNRIAHHEPVLFSPIESKHDTLIEIISQICPITTKYLVDTSTFKNEMAVYKTLKRRKGF